MMSNLREVDYLEILMNRLEYEKNKNRGEYIDDQSLADAAQHLGKMRSQRAIQLLIKGLIQISSSYDLLACFSNVLVAIGKPALEPITAALSDPKPDWLYNYPIRSGSMAPHFLTNAKQRIELGYDSNIQDEEGVDIHDLPDAT
jgi:hypothetical protein